MARCRWPAARLGLGHGAYVAPDWSADWLHREAPAYRALKARELHQTEYESLTSAQRGAVDEVVREGDVGVCAGAILAMCALRLLRPPGKPQLELQAAATK